MWPASGVLAADISGIGVLPGPGASQPVPIASVAKVMTAYIILRDHPLGAAEPGPAIVVQPGEAAAYLAQRRSGGPRGTSLRCNGPVSRSVPGPVRSGERREGIRQEREKPRTDGTPALL